MNNLKIQYQRSFLYIASFVILFSVDSSYGVEAAGAEILNKSISSLKSTLLGDARQLIDAAIVTAGAGGAIMARNWLPLAGSAVALLVYELLCKGLA